MLYLCPYNNCDYTSFDQAEIDEHTTDDHGPEADARYQAEIEAYEAEERAYAEMEAREEDAYWDRIECEQMQEEADYFYNIDDPWYSGSRSDW